MSPNDEISYYRGRISYCRGSILELSRRQPLEREISSLTYSVRVSDRV